MTAAPARTAPAAWPHLGHREHCGRRARRTPRYRTCRSGVGPMPGKRGFLTPRQASWCRRWRWCHTFESRRRPIWCLTLSTSFFSRSLAGCSGPIWIQVSAGERRTARRQWRWRGARMQGAPSHLRDPPLGSRPPAAFPCPRFRQVTPPTHSGTSRHCSCPVGTSGGRRLGS